MNERHETQIMSTSTYELRHRMDKDFKTVELHSHDFCEIYCFLKGEASYIIEDCKYTLCPGDVLIIPPNKLHQLDINDSSKAYERYVLWINLRYLKKISTSKTNLFECFEKASVRNAFLIRSTALSDKVKRLFDSVAYSKNEQFGADIECEEKIKSLLLLLARFFLQNTEDFAVEGKTNACVTKAIEYISEHICEDLSLDTLANALYINKYYFAHVFKDTTNTSPHQFILKKRLILAKQLIEQNIPIFDIYAKCGFADYTHFFRAFKKEFGITPKQFHTVIKG